MMGMDLASLVSSVFGLKDKPRMAMFFPLNPPSWFFVFSTVCFAWFSLTSSLASSRAGL